MNKALKITGITVGSLIVLLLLAGILIPVLFKDKIFNKAKEIANEQLNAVVDFQEMDISVFKNFPNITVSMKQFSVVGKDKFATDTLASATALSTSIDIMAFLKNDIIDIKSVEINDLNVLAKVLADSTVNWDIAKESTSTAPESTAESSDFNMKIEKFVINNGNIIYQDETMALVAGLQHIDFSLKGDMTQKSSMLKMLFSCQSLDVLYDGTHWIHDASLLVDTKVDANMQDGIYTLKETSVEINRIAMTADGSITMKEVDMVFDLNYAAKVGSLQTLLEMIPSSILPDVKNVSTKGTLALNGWVKGVYNETSLPQVWTEFKVQDGSIKYPALPKSVDNIGIDATVLYDGNDDSKTLVNVPRFHFEIAGNPFDMTMRVATPMTDADIKASANGKMDFASLSEALPLEGIQLKGIMTAHIDFAARMSAIEKEKYDQMRLAGTLGLQKFSVTTADLPVPFDIEQAEMEFTPQYVILKSFNSKLGESDIQASGRLDNFLNYVLKDEMLKGTLNLTSKLINCNQLMASSATSGTATTDTAAMTVFVLPSNIDFNMTSQIEKILYDKLTLTKASGGIGLNAGTLSLNNIGAQFAGGQIALSGKYKAVDTQSAQVAMDMGLKNVQVSEMINSFDILNKSLPILSHLGGKGSLAIKFNNTLDQHMQPVLMALTANGTFDADSLRLLNMENFNGIFSLVGMKSTSNSVKKVHAAFSIKDGKVNFQPFGTSIGDTKVMMGGDYSLDKSIDAQVDLQLPTAKVSSAINDLASQLAGGIPKLNATTINVGVAIGGTTSAPTYKLAKAKYFGTSTDTGTPTPSVQEQVKEQVNTVIEEKKEEAKEKVKEEVAKQTENATNKIKDLFKKR